MKKFSVLDRLLAPETDDDRLLRAYARGGIVDETEIQRIRFEVTTGRWHSALEQRIAALERRRLEIINFRDRVRVRGDRAREYKPRRIR